MASRGDGDNGDTVVPLTRRSSLLPPDKGKAEPPEAAAAGDAGAALPAEDDLIAGPQPGDPYLAHSRSGNKPLLTLRFFLKDSAEEGFSYSDLRRIRLLPSGKPGVGPVLLLRFVEAVIVEVRIEGLRMDAMPDYLAYHRIAWVREMPRGTMLADKTAAVVTGITITEVER
jgi:hypothetical protein